MAFLTNNQDEEEQQVQGQAQSPLVGQGSQAVGTTAAAGAQGGTGAGGRGFTNIQSYLEANKGDTGSAQALGKEVGSQFNQERDAFKTDSSNFLKNAEDQLNKEKVTTDQAGQMVEQNASGYSWDGNQSDPYKQNVSKIQNFMTGQYQGPREYNYGLNAKTQNYGTSVNDDAGFDSLMNDIYAKSAAKPLSGGQFQLQKQLDVNNKALVDTRSNLANQYKGLEEERDSTVRDATNKLSGYEQDYRTSQSKLSDFLSGKSNEWEENVTKAENAARDEFDAGERYVYNTKYANPQTRRQYLEQAGQRGGILNNGQELWGRATGQEIPNGERFGTRRLEFLNPGVTPEAGDMGANNLVNDYVRSAIDSNNWYLDQDIKHANVGDNEERYFNAIQDFLNSDTERRKQGFKVRE